MVGAVEIDKIKSEIYLDLIGPRNLLNSAVEESWIKDDEDISNVIN